MNRKFAEDLYSLLIKKNLRIFNGFLDFNPKETIRECEFIFFDYKSAMFRGSFIGFLEAFADWNNRILKHGTLFYENNT